MDFTGILSFAFYLLLTFFLLGILIFVHELGHYLTARLCKVTIHEFALGMGKRLAGFTSKKTGIKYSLRLFPIGGYVAMAGEDEGGEGDDDPNAFHKKNPYQKMLILVAGAAMNILTGFLAMLILTVGMYISGAKLPSTTVAELPLDAPSRITGLREGDVILSVDGVQVHTGYDMTYEITNSGYQPIDLVVLRDGQRVLLKDVRFPVTQSGGVALGNMDFYVLEMPSTPINLLKTTFWRSVSSIKMVFDSLGGIISGRFEVSNLSGPIGVTNTVSEVAQQPMAGWNILYLFAIIAMNLGVMNLLPIPALDGGRLFFRVIEALRFGKPFKPEFEARLHGVGMMLLLLFTAVIALKDIWMMF